MKRNLEDAEMPIEYTDRLREYFVRGADVLQCLAFCPFCGAELPVSVRREWFRRLRAMGLEPWEDVNDRPAAYQSGAWWRSDPVFVDPRNDGYAITPVDLRHFVLAMGLRGPVRLLDILEQAQELTGDPFLVPATSRTALSTMVEHNEVAAIHDVRETDGRWPEPVGTWNLRLVKLLADDGPALGAWIPGLQDYETLNAISFETSASTHAEAEEWVAENRQLWDMIVTDLS